MTLIVIHFNDLVFIMLRLYKAAAVLSVLMKVYTIPCHDRGHVNVMLVLQSCTDPLRILPTSSSETFPTSSDGTYDGDIEIEEDVAVIEESFIAVNKEADICIKEEETPEDITSSDINSEPDEVSYVCVCVYACLLQTNDYFFRCQYFWPIETAPLLRMNNFCCHYVLLRGGV